MVVFAVIVEPCRVENVPERVEKEETYIEDWIVRVDLISISLAVYFWPVSVETVRISLDIVENDAVDPISVEKWRTCSVMVEATRLDVASVVKYPVVVDSVGTWMDDRTVREEVTCASCEVRKLDWMELVVMVDPISDWKYPVVVDSVGTWMDDRTVREEVM